MAWTMPSVAVELDVDRDASWSLDLAPSISDTSGGIRFKRGLNSDGLYQTSTLIIEVDNQTGDFSPQYQSGPNYGKLVPDTPVRVVVTQNATPYTIWTGYVQEWRTDLRRGWDAKAVVECADLSKYMKQGEPVNVSVSKVRDTDGAIQAVLEAQGFTSGDWTLADGVQDLAYSFAVGQEPLDAVLGFALAEMVGLYWIGADGKHHFEARNSRLGTTVDSTWGDTTDIEPESITTWEVDSDIISGAHVRGTRYIDGQDGEELFRLQLGRDTPSSQTIQVPANTKRTWVFELSAPALSINAAVATTDYAANDSADSSGTDRTSDQTVTYTLVGSGKVKVDWENTHSGAIHITFLRVTGQSTALYADRPEAHYEVTITGRKANTILPVDIPWVSGDATVLADFAAHLTNIYRWPWDRLELDFGWDSDAMAQDLLSREIGDLVRFVDTAGGIWSTGLDEWFYVDSLEFTLVPGREFRTRVGLVPSYLFRNLDRIRWDSFTRANSTGDLGTPDDTGAAWVDDASMDIVSNEARTSSNGEVKPYLEVGTGATDQVVGATYQNITTTDLVGVHGRYQDSSNFYYAYLDNDADQVYLQKRVAGGSTVLANPAHTIGAGPHTIELFIQGTRLRVRVDGEWLIDETDSALSSGTKAGLLLSGAQNSATCPVFYVEALN